MMINLLFATVFSAGPKENTVGIADKWTSSWRDNLWDEQKGIYKLAQGPYGDAFEWHYVGAVLINTEESKYYHDSLLIERLKRDILYHSELYINNCRDKKVWGYWQLNGTPELGGGSWQPCSFIRACRLLDNWMTTEEKAIWREGAEALIIALTRDFQEIMGPWWSTNKIAAHIAAVGESLRISNDSRAKAYLDEQFDWFWKAFPHEGLADKYLNYFAKTLYRLAPIVLVDVRLRLGVNQVADKDGLSEWKAAFMNKVFMLRGLISPQGLYDFAGHDEPLEGGQMGKLGAVVAIFLLASPEHPQLAVLANHIVQQRFSRYDEDIFMDKSFIPLFGAHQGTLGLIIESTPIWEPVLSKSELRYEDLRFFDYWEGLGLVAVKTANYHTSTYLRYGHSWPWAHQFGGVLFRLNTPGDFSEKREAGRAWLDWSIHADPETGGQRNSLVVATKRCRQSRHLFGEEKFSEPPFYPVQSLISGVPGDRLYGFTHSCYDLEDKLQVVTNNLFLDDMVIVFNNIKTLTGEAFDKFYVTSEFSDPGDLFCLTSEGNIINFSHGNRKTPEGAEEYPVSGWFVLQAENGSGALGFMPLANSYEEMKLVDFVPMGKAHRVEAWRGYLPRKNRAETTIIADHAFIPHQSGVSFDKLAENLKVIDKPQGHGVHVAGEASVTAAQITDSGTFGDFEVKGVFFAAEVKGGVFRKLSLLGEEVRYKGKRILQLSRPAAVTVVWNEGKIQGCVDSGVGPIDITIRAEMPSPQVSFAGRVLSSIKVKDTNYISLRLMSENHDYPKKASLKQQFTITDQPEGATIGEERGHFPKEMQFYCDEFSLLPALFEHRVKAMEIDFLIRALEARLSISDAAATEEIHQFASEAKRWLSAVEDTISKRDFKASGQELMEVELSVIKGHQKMAELSEELVGSPESRDFNRPFSRNYIISFGEEEARNALKKLAKALILSAKDEEGRNSPVRATESELLTHYIGIPIHWTRGHVPEQAEFLWRPFGTEMLEAPPMDWELTPLENALLTYLTDREKNLLCYERPKLVTEILEGQQATLRVAVLTALKGTQDKERAKKAQQLVDDGWLADAWMFMNS